MNNAQIAPGLDPAGVENSADLADLLEIYASFSLPTPPLPVKYAALLRETGDNLFSTRPELTSLYDLTLLATMWAEKFPEPFLAYGFDGYGIASQRMQCAMAGTSLALALEVPLGNVYADPAQELADAKAMLALFWQFFRLTSGGDELPNFPDEKWLILSPANRPAAWQRWQNGKQIPVDSDTPVADALAKLTYLPAN